MRKISRNFSKHILLCNGKSCIRNGADEVTKAIRDEIHRQQASRDIHTTKTLCNGRCEEGPIIIVYPDDGWYGEMTGEEGRNMIK
ncbi:ferredoxin [Bacillus songklensis]|uniref:Ferredoxin n=1 Tax=Bacillus songklensis TaxID=1069116 RepID=A0ABV8AWX5_9BACI